MEGTTRVTIKEAARLEGVGAGAIRKRIERGTLHHDKGDDGRVYVYLPVEYDAGHDTAEASANDQVEDLREQVAYLRQLLDAEQEARAEEGRRKDHIIAGLMQRIPEIESAEHHEPSETAGRSGADSSGGGDRTDHASESRANYEPQPTIAGRLKRWLRSGR